MQRRVQRHTLKVWWGGALTALVLGVGVAVTWPRSPTEGSPEVTLARDMSAHHAQAVNMSVTLFKRAADPAVKLLAQDILLGQQAQIGQMQGWLMAWGRPLAGQDAPMAGMDRARMGLASRQEEQALQRLPTATAEVRYLILMRRHHVGGVAMAQSALMAVKRPEVRTFATRVVTAQTAEIAAIDALLKRRMGGKGVPAPPEMDGMGHE